MLYGIIVIVVDGWAVFPLYLNSLPCEADLLKILDRTLKGEFLMGKEERASLDTARRELANELGKLEKVSRDLLEPLKTLDERQVVALVALVHFIRIVQLAGRPAAKIDEAVLTRLDGMIGEIRPPLGKAQITKDPCLEATASYLSALQECREEDPPKDEDECPDAWGPAGQSLTCTMEALEEMKGQLIDMIGRLEPPGPIPWPIR